jgi:hypothetical protein
VSTIAPPIVRGFLAFPAFYPLGLESLLPVLLNLGEQRLSKRGLYLHRLEQSVRMQLLPLQDFALPEEDSHSQSSGEGEKDARKNRPA